MNRLASAVTLTLAVLPLVATGCTTSRSVGSDLAPSTVIRIDATGEHPFLSVDNRGPGRVVAVFDPGTQFAVERIVEPGTSTGRTVEGGSLTVETDAEPASVRIEALKADGLALTYPRLRSSGSSDD